MELEKFTKSFHNASDVRKKTSRPTNQTIGHPVLDRLIEEVRFENRHGGDYDRTHNRHNRGQ